MKVVIEIPDDEYRRWKEDGEIDAIVVRDALMQGVPLDEIKAEIEKQIERDFAFAETETLKVPCHYGTANGLQVAVRIIDSYKSEVQDGQGSGN